MGCLLDFKSAATTTQPAEGARQGASRVVRWGDDPKRRLSVDGTGGAAMTIAAGANHGCASQAGSNAVVCRGADSHSESRTTLSPWRNHGKFVSCTAHAAEGLLDRGTLIARRRRG